MKRRNSIIYWFFTLWLALGMTSTGIVQLLKMKEETDLFAHLGYPAYLLTMIGVWKILGVVAVLIPKFPLLKEWTYAGFFFCMSGAIVSHWAMGDPISQVAPPLLLLVLTVISWYARPEDRRLVPVQL